MLLGTRKPSDFTAGHIMTPNCSWKSPPLRLIVSLSSGRVLGSDLGTHRWTVGSPLPTWDRNDLDQAAEKLKKLSENKVLLESFVQERKAQLAEMEEVFHHLLADPGLNLTSESKSCFKVRIGLHGIAARPSFRISISTR